MKVYYQDDAVTIYHGDCREILPSLSRVDLVLTDPPYGIGWVTNSKKRFGGIRAHFIGKDEMPIIGDDKPFDPRPFLIAEKLIFWGANNYAHLLPPNYGWIVWDKRPNGERNTQSDAELAWTNFLHSVRTHRQRWMGCMRDGAECPFVGGALKHPTQKPINLMKFCISLAGTVQTILDPFMGTGTSLRAAKDLGLKAVGIEIEERYCEIAAKRMSQEVLQFS